MTFATLTVRRLWLTATQVGLSPERTEQLVAEERAAFPDLTPTPNRP